MSVRVVTRLRAWTVLARAMTVQLARLPFRGSELAGEPGRAFRGAVALEGYLPLSAAERAEFPAFTRCIACGLCALACPALRDTPAAAWAEAWTFVSGPSRMLERSTLAAASLEPCARCAACAAVCPTGVPIPRLAAMVERLAGLTPAGTDA